MSLKSKAQAVCQKCGHKHTIDIFKSINTATDPELKEKVISGEQFLWECPECGTSNLVAYDCLYHDPDEKIMVWMLPFGSEDEPQQLAIMNQAKAMGEYRLRIVANAGDLMEKVIIFNCGLDDRCIELVKYVGGKELEGVTNLHFYRMQDDVMVFSGVKEGKMQGFGFGVNVYEDCAGILQRNPEIAREDGFEKIDADWVGKILA